MRKILLASTALVALGVSAASADISISGSGKWSYKSISDSTAGASGDSFSTSMGITVASSFASDSGLTYGTSHSLANGSNDGMKVYVSGSFGEFRVGGASAGAAYDVDAAVTDGEASSPSGYSGKASTGKATDNGISYFTPSVNGFSAGVSFDDAGAGASDNDDVTEMGASYSQAVGDATVKLSYATRDTSAATTGGNGSSATSMGASITMGDLSVTLAANTQKTDNGSEDGSGTGIGVSYVLSEGLTLKAHTISGEDDADTSVDNTETAASLTYVVAPGLTANIAYTDSEAGSTTSNATTAYLKVAF